MTKARQKLYKEERPESGASQNDKGVDINANYGVKEYHDQTSTSSQDKKMNQPKEERQETTTLKLQRNQQKKG